MLKKWKRRRLVGLLERTMSVITAAHSALIPLLLNLRVIVMHA